jgi:hypothetical protein
MHSPRRPYTRLFSIAVDASVGACAALGGSVRGEIGRQAGQ